jgi:hypothetical protein
MLVMAGGALFVARSFLQAGNKAAAVKISSKKYRHMCEFLFITVFFIVN